LSHGHASGESTKPNGQILRLFIAYTLPTSVIGAIGSWQQRELAGTDVRMLPADHLHVTLVFMGSRPAADVPVVTGVMETCTASSRQPVFTVHKYHETARVGMLRLREDALAGDHYAGRANQFVGHLMRELEARQMYRREYRSWRPHITVSRFRTAPRLRPAPPDLGVFKPPAVVLFKSVTAPSGSVYEQLAAVPLGDDEPFGIGA
jgi:2'-5' RNA ligase